MTRTISCLAGLVAMMAHGAQAQTRAYPAPPLPLGEAAEVELAMSAAPPEVAMHADVYVLRGTAFVKARSGTNGCACMVGRDYHDEARYPICYDREGARTLIERELLEGSMRAKGVPEADVQKAVEAGYANGTLKVPAVASIAYMMSPRQVLFSSANAEGTRVGPWSPHLMVTLPNVAPDQLGLAPQSTVDVIQIYRRGAAHSEMVVKVPKWSDGTPVARR